MKKRIVCIALIVIIIFSFSACKISPEENMNSIEAVTVGVNDAGEWIGSGLCYSAETLSTVDSIYDMTVLDGDIYIVSSYNNGKQILLRESEVLCTFDGSIYGIDGEKDLVFVCEIIYKDKFFKPQICSISKDGEKEVLCRLGEDYYDKNFSDILICSDEKIYVICEDTQELIIFNLHSSEITCVPLPSDNIYMVKSGDGKVYIIENTLNGNQSYLVEDENATIIPSFLLENGKIFSGNKEMHLAFINEVGFFTVDCNGNMMPFIIWRECGISLGTIENLYYYDVGEYLVKNYTGMCMLKPAKPSEIKIKEELTIATIGQPYNLQILINQFNLRDTEYYVRVVDYSSGGAVDAEQALTKLNLDLISGKMPDMVCFENISPYPYINKGLLVDICSLIEEDEEISFDDISIIQALKIHGKVFFLSNKFTLETLVARYSDFGDKYGWTLDEYLNADAEATENCHTLYNMTQKGFLERVSSRYIKDAVDWQNSTCDFDNESFAKILEASVKIKENPENENNMIYAYGPTMVGTGQLKAAASWVNQVWKLAFEEKMAGCKLSFIGWPSVDGSCGSDIFLVEPIGIISSGKHESGCWRFMKYMLTSDALDDQTMPVYTPLLKKEIEEAKNDESLPVKMSENDEQRFFSLIKAIDSCNMNDKEIMNIILSNSQGIVSEYRSVEEISKIIQSKVSIYLAEQK